MYLHHEIFRPFAVRRTGKVGRFFSEKRAYVLSRSYCTLRNSTVMDTSINFHDKVMQSELGWKEVRALHASQMRYVLYVA